MANKGRKHYRVVKRVAMEKPKQNGVYVPIKPKHLTFFTIASFLILVFVKGIVIGYIIGRKRCDL